jgi:hypothetical protein
MYLSSCHNINNNKIINNEKLDKINVDIYSLLQGQTEDLFVTILGICCASFTKILAQIHYILSEYVLTREERRGERRGEGREERGERGERREERRGEERGEERREERRRGRGEGERES